MNEAKKVARFVAKALFCLVLSWALVLLTLGHVLIYFRISLPIGLLIIPGAVGIFLFFSTLEKRPRG